MSGRTDPKAGAWVLICSVVAVSYIAQGGNVLLTVGIIWVIFSALGKFIDKGDEESSTYIRPHSTRIFSAADRDKTSRATNARRY